MRSLCLSGGSTKIAMLAGAAVAILKYKKYKPTYIIGVSAGAILTVPLAMEMYNTVNKYVKNFDLNDIFTKHPVDKKGKVTLSALWRVLRGKESLGTQDKLTETLSQIISKEKFEEYKRSSAPICLAGIVEFKTGKRKYINLKECDYEGYLQAVLASSSIPIFVESVKSGPEYWYDGGVRDHIGSHWLMENVKLKENISIYSRPSSYNIEDLSWRPSNVLTVLERTIEIMNMEISKNDQFKEEELAKEKNILNTQVFPNKRLATSTYELNKIKLEDWYKIGFTEGLNYTNTNLI